MLGRGVGRGVGRVELDAWSYGVGSCRVGPTGGRSRKSSAGCFEWEQSLAPEAGEQRPRTHLMRPEHLQNCHQSVDTLHCLPFRAIVGLLSEVDGPLVTAMTEGCWVLLSHAEQAKPTGFTSSTCCSPVLLRTEVFAVSSKRSIQFRPDLSTASVDC